MDSYQAVYDAVRSRISNGNVGDVVADVARQSFDISNAVANVATEYASAADAQRRAAFDQMRPSVLFRPALSADGTAWCALYGENLQEGIAGFGDTPEQAMVAFDLAWMNERTPASRRAFRASP